MRIHNILAGVLKTPINNLPLEKPENKLDTALMVTNAITGLGKEYSISRVLKDMEYDRLKFSPAEKQAIDLLLRMIGNDDTMPTLGLLATLQSYQRLIRDATPSKEGVEISVSKYMVDSATRESDTLLGTYGSELSYNALLVFQSIIRSKYRSTTNL